MSVPFRVLWSSVMSQPNAHKHARYKNAGLDSEAMRRRREEEVREAGTGDVGQTVRVEKPLGCLTIFP